MGMFQANSPSNFDTFGSSYFPKGNKGPHAAIPEKERKPKHNAHNHRHEKRLTRSYMRRRRAAEISRQENRAKYGSLRYQIDHRTDQFDDDEWREHAIRILEFFELLRHL